MRLGIFGGSFDPVHLGHLELARCCQRQAALDEVWFTPAATQPLKQHGPRAGGDDRCAMLRLAMAERDDWRLCEVELERGGLSYTADTLRTVATMQPEAKLFFLMGADSLGLLPTWKEPEVISRLATPLVVRRAGEPEPDFTVLEPFVDAARIEQIQKLQIEMPEMPISSSAIRRQIAEGKDVAHLLPERVASYIAEKKPVPLIHPRVPLAPPVPVDRDK